MTNHDQKSEARLADLERELAKVARAWRENVPGWASDFSAIVRELVTRSPNYNLVKPSARGWVDYIEWFSLISAGCPTALRGLGTLWWVDQSEGKQVHIPLPLEVETHRVNSTQLDNVLYTLRFHDDGILTCFYNNKIDERTDHDLLEEYLSSADSRRVFGISDLMAAVCNEDVEIVRRLAAGVLDINARDAGGNTAILLSSLFGNTEMTSVLRGKDADIRLRNDEGYSAVDIARRNRFNNIIELLSPTN